MRRIAVLNGRFSLMSAVTVSAVALYALSIGPACRLARHDMLTVSQVANVYRPILALDFQLPPSLQAVLTTYVDLYGAREKLEAARDEPFFRTYEVGDFSARFRKRTAWPAFFEEARGNYVRFSEFDACEALAELIADEVEDDTWDHVGGRGSIEPDSKARSLLVFQSRRVHAGIEALLAELRRIRRENLPGRDLDLQSLLRVRSQRAAPSRDSQSLCELESHAVILDRHPEGHWECDGLRFATADALFLHLEQQPQDFFRFGILACEPHKARWPDERDRLEKFCRSQDIDLFVYSYERDSRLYYVAGDLPPRLQRVVRARESMYDE